MSHHEENSPPRGDEDTKPSHPQVSGLVAGLKEASAVARIARSAFTHDSGSGVGVGGIVVIIGLECIGSSTPGISTSIWKCALYDSNSQTVPLGGICDAG